MSDIWRPCYIGGRPIVLSALRRLPDTEVVSHPDAADLIVIDLQTYYFEDLHAQLAALDPRQPRLVLSRLGLTTSPALRVSTETAELEGALLNVSSSCVLRCAPLGQSLGAHLEWVRKIGTLHGCYADRGVAWLHADDLAALIRTLAHTPSRFSGAYDVTGPRRITMSELVALLSTALRQPIDYLRLPADQYHQVLMESGLAEHVAQRLVGSQILASADTTIDHTEVLHGAIGHATPLDEYLDTVVAATATTPIIPEPKAIR